jgi:hypothetical protein
MTLATQYSETHPPESQLWGRKAAEGSDWVSTILRSHSQVMLSSFLSSSMQGTVAVEEFWIIINTHSET